MGYQADFDPSRVRRELVRAMRGNLRQIALSQKLGFKGNQLYRWESATVNITWEEFCALAMACEISVTTALLKSCGYARESLRASEVIRHLCPGYSGNDLSKILGLDIQAVRRILRGASSPPLDIVLQILWNQNLLITFLESLELKRDLPWLKIHRERASKAIEAEKKLVRDHPYAMLACAMIDALRSRYREGDLSRLLQIPRSKEKEMLALLSTAGMIKREKGKLSFDLLRPSESGFQSMRPMIQYLLKWFQYSVGKHHEKPTHAIYRGGVLSCPKEKYFEILELSRGFMEKVNLILRVQDQNPKSTQAAFFLGMDLL